MQVIFLIGSVQALFFSILVFNKKNKSVSDKILGVWLLLFAFQLIFPFLVYSDYKRFIHWGGVDAPLIPLHAIFLFVYTKALMSKQNKFEKSWLLNLIPAAITLISSIPFYMYSREVKILMYEDKIEYPKFIFALAMLMLFFIAFYLIRTLQFLYKHKVNIHQEYSYEKNIDLKWLRNLVITMCVFAVLMLAGSFNFLVRVLSLTQSDFLLYCYIVLFVYAIGYWGYKQGKVFVYTPVQKNEEKKVIKGHKNLNQETSLSKSDQAIVERLKELMVNDKPYINNELNLYDLASELNIPSAHLSYVLNSCLNMNFYQFVNKYRVEEAQQRIVSNDAQKFTLLTIAFESGFNSKASFNRIFKNIAGVTPSEYQKSVNQ